MTPRALFHILLLTLFLLLSLPCPTREVFGQGKVPQIPRESPADNLRRLQEMKRGRPAPYTLSSPAGESSPGTAEVQTQATAAQAPAGSQQPRAEERDPHGRGEIPVKGDLITMNFRDVDLHVLVKFMSDLMGKNFVIEPNVKGTMTILSQEKITPEEAYQVFLSTLDVYGLAAVPSGKVIKIIQASDAKAKGVETFVRSTPRVPGDKIVTQILPLKNGDAADMARLLAPLVPKSGLMVPYTETNTLILIDTESNIRRLTQILSELDVPDSKGSVHIFELENASAKKLAPRVSQLFQSRRVGISGAGAAAGAGEQVKIFPDERTNSLVVMAPAAQVAEIRQLLERLDRKTDRQSGNARILTLKYAKAEDLAKMLTEIPAKGGERAGDDKDKGKSATPLSKEVQIYPDKATNSLVIIAEQEEFDFLEDIIRRLDIPRTMVFVEALIMEVSAAKSLDLGVEWFAAQDYNGGFRPGSSGGMVLGGSPGGAEAAAMASAVIPSGLSIGVVGRAITMGNVVFPNFSAFVRAVQSDTNFNILSTPQILTLDNAEAVIEVGQNIPFVTRVDQPSQVTERAIQTFEYKDVGVSLKVTPQINEDRTVRLKVEQSIKSVVERTALGGTVLAPTTTFRRAKTDITVNDGDTAVIGGLIENRMDRGNTQTPCLGGIPGLGWLFKSVSDHDEKTNLLVFLSPRIVENQEAGRRLYEQKQAQIDQTLEEARKRQQQEKIRRMFFE
ncbi:MAG: type II secretion system protein GspD [Desulfobacteraceae bacterium]|nr:MAG: type II secretion system protein GspD [Desulfobacteraceae bacterium]